MKKTICFYFQVHQPDRLRLYRFFDIGKDSWYYDEFANKTILRRVAERLLPSCKRTDAGNLSAFTRGRLKFRIPFRE